MTSKLQRGLRQLIKQSHTKVALEKVCFDKQLDFVKDRSFQKWILTPRRSGKSYSVGLFFIQEALAHPGTRFLFCAKTGTQAENIIWKDTLQKIIHANQIPLRKPYMSVQKLLQFSNDSSIKLIGMDNAASDVEKWTGGKYWATALDECQDYKQDVHHIYKKIEPASQDYRDQGGGFIIMSGTPGQRMGDHYFYQLTKQLPDGSPSPDRLPGWSGHEWHMYNNPHMAEAWKRICEDRLRDYGDKFMEDPSFQREYLARWVIDQDTNVYKFGKSNLLDSTFDSPVIAELLNAHPRFTYVIGVDLGFVDATGFVVGAYSETERVFYVVESFKKPGLLPAQIESLLRIYVEKYGARQVVVDEGGLGKMISRSFNESGIPCYAASKQDKSGHVAQMNSDFLGKRIQIIEPTNGDLIRELEGHKLDRRALEQHTWKESKATENHLTDALLYAWRESLHRLSRAVLPPKEPDFAELLQERARRSRFSTGSSALQRHQEKYGQSSTDMIFRDIARRRRFAT